MKIGTRTLVLVTSVTYLGQFFWYALTHQWGRFAGLALVAIVAFSLGLAGRWMSIARKRKASEALLTWRHERDQTR